MQGFRAAFKKLQEMFERPNVPTTWGKKIQSCDGIPRKLSQDIRLRWAVASQNALLESQQRLFEVLLNSLTFTKCKKANTDRLFKHLIGRVSLDFLVRYHQAHIFTHGQTMISLPTENIQGEDNHNNLTGIFFVMRLQKQQ